MQRAVIRCLTAPFGQGKHLVKASKEGDLKEVKEILLNAEQRELDYVDRSSGYTPLHWASEYGYTEITALLLRHGATVDIRENFNFTPLFLACQNHHPKVVSLLLDHQADVNDRTHNCTALHYAAFEGNADVLDVLLEKRADINARDEFGRTSLYMAAQKGQKKVVKHLLKRGASPAVKCSQDVLPAEVAKRKGFVQIADIIDATSSGVAYDMSYEEMYGRTPSELYQYGGTNYKTNHMANSPRGAQLSAHRLSTPRLGTPRLGTPRLGTPRLGTPRLNTPRRSAVAVVTPTSTLVATAGQISESRFDNDFKKEQEHVLGSPQGQKQLGEIITSYGDVDEYISMSDSNPEQLKEYLENRKETFESDVLSDSTNDFSTYAKAKKAFTRKNPKEVASEIDEGQFGHDFDCDPSELRQNGNGQVHGIKSVKNDLESEVAKEAEAKLCRLCGGPSRSYCGKCGMAYYCGRDHQKQDWNRHRRECIKDAQQKVVLLSNSHEKLGIRMRIFHNHWHVKTIHEKSTARQSGIVLGDILVEINKDHPPPSAPRLENYLLARPIRVQFRSPKGLKIASMAHFSEKLGVRIRCDDRKDSTFFVTHVKRDYVASKVGVNVGDELVLANNNPPPNSQEELLQILHKRPLVVWFAIAERAGRERVF